MAHQRKLIRHAVAAALTSVTAAGARVKASRVEPNRAGQLPAIGVYTLTEDTEVEDAGSAPRELWRTLDLKVEAIVPDSAAVPWDDACDDIAEQIEAAMDADRYFGGTCVNSILTGTEMGTAQEQGADPLVGVVTLTYQVEYRTSPATGAGLDEYLRTGATTQIDGAGDDNTVSDLFNQRP